MVSILLVLFNQAGLTLGCLKSIEKYAQIPIELIVVDNDSTDRTAELMESVKNVKYIKNSVNLHFLRAVNMGMEHCRGKYILLLNNDAELLHGTLEAAVQRIESDSMIGAVGGKIILIDDNLQEAGSIVWQNGSCLGYGRGKISALELQARNLKIFQNSYEAFLDQQNARNEKNLVYARDRKTWKKKVLFLEDRVPRGAVGLDKGGRNTCWKFS